jgi:hypothetical protein
VNTATATPIELIVNMSVWEDLESLFAYVYRSDHLQVMAQRRLWFEKPAGAFMALWWLPRGRLPSFEAGRRRAARRLMSAYALALRRSRPATAPARPS